MPTTRPGTRTFEPGEQDHKYTGVCQQPIPSAGIVRMRACSAKLAGAGLSDMQLLSVPQYPSPNSQDGMAWEAFSGSTRLRGLGDEADWLASSRPGYRPAALDMAIQCG